MLATLVVATGSARGDGLDDRATGARGAADVNGFAATASYQIPIELPGRPGAMPELGLRYGSSGGNGWLGAGWSVSGLPVIERIGAGGGTPRWDRSDTYALDGERLVACRGDAPMPPARATTGTPPTITPGSPTPGCAAGGSHATRIESYRRILYDPARDRWVVTSPDGVRRSFDRVFAPAPDRPLRYGLTEIEDLHGNRVTVQWQRDALGCCTATPASISYDDVTATLWWQARPDRDTAAWGGGLETRNARLSAITITAGGQPVAAYRLDYTTSAAGARSLLAAVTRYGRDYQLAAGSVTGGTAAPPYRFRYDDAAVSTYRITATPLPAGYATNPDSFQTADIDGDGRADLVHVGAHHGRRIVTWRGKPDGSFAAPVQFDPGWGIGTTPYDFSQGGFYPVDVDGDARADLVQLSGGWGGFAWHSLGDGRYTAIAAPAGKWYCDTSQCRNQWSTMAAFPADVDGDGKTDFIFAETRSPYTGPLGGPHDPANLTIHRFRVSFARTASNGALTWVDGAVELTTPLVLASSASCGSYTCTSSGALLTGDADGDGKADLFFVEEGKVSVFLSTGAGFASAPSSVQSGAIRPNTTQSKVIAGDWNGDGRTDLLAVPLQLAPVPITAWLSRGDGSFAVQPSFTFSPQYGTYPSASQRFLVGDIDGDGKTDVIHVLANELYTWLSSGDGGFHTMWTGGLTAQGNNFDAMTTGDVDGDGRMDVVYLPLGPGLESYRPDGSGRPLLGEVTTPLGGATRFSYQPSTTWPSAHVGAHALTSTVGMIGSGRGAGAMPSTAAFATVTAVTQDDGRGGVATTTYGYEGALYDPVERELLGFRLARATAPAAAGGAITETYYLQGYGLIAVPEEIDVRFPDGTFARSSVHEYQIGAQVPYTQPATGVWTYEYGTPPPRPPPPGGPPATASATTGSLGRGTLQAARRRYVQRDYDAWGNVVVEADHGDFDQLGDERTVITRYVVATDRYLVDRVSERGVTTFADEVLAWETTGYDGQAAGAPPTIGDPTQRWRWLDRTGDGITGDDRWIGEQVQFDARGNRVSVTDALGATRTTVYDAAGRFAVAAVDPLGATTTAIWDPVCGVAIATTDPAGASTTTTLDALCRPIATHGPMPEMTTTVDYAALTGAPATQFVARRGPDPSRAAPWVEDRTYLDGAGRPWRQIRAAGTAIAACQDRIYDAAGSVAAVSRPYACDVERPQWERTTYDAVGRPIAQLHADGTGATVAYSLGQTDRTDEIGHRTTELSDVRGRVIAHREWLDGAPRDVSILRDALDRAVETLDAAGNATTAAYDSLGRTIASHDPDLGDRRQTYDDADRAIETFDARGHRITTAYDPAGRPVARGSDRPPASVVRATVRAASPAAFSLVVDGRAVQTGEADPDGTMVTWLGPVTGSIAIARGADDEALLEIAELAVDGSDLTAGVAVPPGCGAPAALACGIAIARVPGGSAIAYDRAGRPVLWLDDSGTATARYDLAGRMIERAVAIGDATYTVLQTWGPTGELLGTAYPDGEVVGRDPRTGDGAPLPYDALGRPTAIPGVITAATWDARGDLRRLALANGTVAVDDIDPARGWLTRTQVTGTAGAILDLSYGSDARGRVTAVRGTDSFDYVHDELGRLIEVRDGGAATVRHRYAYDITGNLTAMDGVAYAYPAAGAPRPHAVQRRGDDAFSYDAAGNLVSGGGRTIAWDTMDRPSAITTAAGTTRFSYDAAGQRRTMETDGVVTVYAFAGYQVTGGVVTRTVSLGDRVIAERRGGAWRWLHTDRLGSVRAVSDAAGAVIERRDYAPYGASAGATTAGFLGAPHDATGLVYLDARYYDPVLGRFLSADTATPACMLGLDRYGYAFDDPVSLTDRHGHDPWSEYLGQFEQAVRNDQALVDKLHKWFDFGIRFYGPAQRQNSLPWTVADLDTMTRSLAQLEQALGNKAMRDKMGLSPMRQQYSALEIYKRRANGRTLGGFYPLPVPGSLPIALIGIYEPTLAAPPEAARFTLFHEIGHMIGWAAHPKGVALFPTIPDSDWLVASGWKGTWASAPPWQPPQWAPTEYAYTSPEEDFADSFAIWAHYKLDPAIVPLRVEGPLQYNPALMRTRFDYIQALFDKPPPATPRP